jgi:hypothetical protein
MRNYRNYTEDDIKESVKNSLSLSEVLRKLKIKPMGGNFDTLKRKLAKLEIDTSHFTGRVWSKGKSVKDWADYKKNHGRKKILITERGHQCEDCKNTHWKDQLIILELHHINGDRVDNSSKNLQLLCCNCHATTDNWRNKKRQI